MLRIKRLEEYYFVKYLKGNVICERVFSNENEAVEFYERQERAEFYRENNLVDRKGKKIQAKAIVCYDNSRMILFTSRKKARAFFNIVFLVDSNAVYVNK